MVRASSIVLGAGLIIIWLAGLVSHATAWVTWMDAVAAVGAFGIAAAIVPHRAGLAAPVGTPIALAIALFLIWIVALSIGATTWLAWLNFAVGVAFTILGLLAIGERTPTTPTVTQPRAF